MLIGIGLKRSVRENGDSSLAGNAFVQFEYPKRSRFITTHSDRLSFGTFGSDNHINSKIAKIARIIG